jgi:hypothetical protein
MPHRLIPAALVGRALIAGVCTAALAAILALVQGDRDDTHANVVATSLSFSVASATAGAGDALRVQVHNGWRVVVGNGVLVASTAAFVLFVVALWFDGGEAVWRACGVAALLALCGSHASLVLRARRPADTPFIDALVTTSIAAATFDTLVGSVAAAGAVDHVSDDFVRLVAVVLVVMLLSTALAPLLRRVGTATSLPQADAFGRRAAPQRQLTLDQMADEVAAVARRLDALESSPAVAREVQALRELTTRARS